jgi:hypothetical protein
MNKRNDWQSDLEWVNKTLGRHDYSLKIYEPEEEGFYSLDILKDGKVVETYAENYYEEELSDLITDAMNYVFLNLIKK